MNPFFPKTRIATAIAAVSPALWRQPTKARQDAPKLTEVENPMTDCDKTQPEAPAFGWLADLDWAGGDDHAGMIQTAVFEADPKLEQYALIKIIGARMREARELCNMSQSVAARQFGYSNPSKLSKVEGATDTNSVPLWLIVRAAKLYDVSCDFLLGMSDEWEIGVPRGVTGWLLDAWEAARRRDLALLDRLHRRIEATGQVIPRLADDAQAVLGAALRVRDLNPEFDDLRGGARLVAASEQLAKSTTNACVILRRFHWELTRQAAAPEISAGGHHAE